MKPYTETNTAGSITIGGTAQVAVAASATRIGLTIQNLSLGDLFMNGGGTSTPNGDSEWVPAGSENDFGSLVSAVSIYGATTGQKFLVIEKFAA